MSIINETANDLLLLLLHPKKPWQVHNCKINEQVCHQDGTLPFLYHYDQLSDEQKQQYPLTPTLLSQFNQPMTTDNAKQLLMNTYAINDNAIDIASPWYVRIAGSAVLYQPELLLALRLHWQSSTQKLQPIYCQNQHTAIQIAIDGWTLYGRVDVLYQGKSPLYIATMPINGISNHVSTDANNSSDVDNGIGYLIPNTGAYHLLPMEYAVSLLTELNENLNALYMLDDEIKARVQ